MGDLLYLESVGIIDRVYTDREIVGDRGASKNELREVGPLLAELRRLIAIKCGLFSHGRVIVASTRRVRIALQTDWAQPQNADFLHFGALRGVDFAKGHVAAISIGRLELPPRVLDGLAAALGFDDPDPTEVRAGEQPVITASRTLMMRDGTDVEIEVPERADRWGLELQRQFRENELVQFAGRLRPVYRDGIPPVWFCLGRALPPEIIWDRLSFLRQETTVAVGEDHLPQNLWEFARRCGGIISPDLALVKCRDLVSRELMRETFYTNGIDVRDGTVASSFPLMGWSKLIWYDGAGSILHAWASAHLADPEHVLRSELQESGYDVRSVEIVSLAEKTGSEKPLDEIDRKVGSISARREREDVIREDSLLELQEFAASNGQRLICHIGFQVRREIHGLTVERFLEGELAALAIEQSRGQGSSGPPTDRRQSW